MFARLEITTPAGAVVPVDIAVDWRAYQPAQFDVGPVLDERDAAASKIDALMSRSLPRDFLDADSIRNDGRFTEDKLLEVTAYRFGSSFDRAELGYALRQVMRVRPEDVAEYGVDPRGLDQIMLRLVEWAETVSPPGPGEIDITPTRAVFDANRPGPAQCALPQPARPPARVHTSRHRTTAWVTAANTPVQRAEKPPASAGPQYGRRCRRNRILSSHSRAPRRHVALHACPVPVIFRGCCPPPTSRATPGGSYSCPVRHPKTAAGRCLGCFLFYPSAASSSGVIWPASIRALVCA
ncbi:hypothetical protein [Arthrobacter globiformis]|uniref:Uncharacterized protein n=1 Tax=Arthrobacter globiformis TaxID=1665 RepID=A0A328HF60_ARTGO|nr:hypothetical protein [Arthrobacter globiformis]RAM37279.1 hypothetical protein DBZ45_10690 [Arthrobacter globiformis]